MPTNNLTTTNITVNSISSSQFVTWLRGFLDAAGKDITPEQVSIIKAEIAKVCDWTFTTYPGYYGTDSIKSKDNMFSYEVWLSDNT